MFGQFVRIIHALAAPRTNKGKLSNLLILIPLFWVWWSRKRESEMIGFHRLPPEFGNWWK
jgi:hypothetical protein